jgi:hypothetical protein
MANIALFCPSTCCTLFLIPSLRSQHFLDYDLTLLVFLVGPCDLSSRPAPRWTRVTRLLSYVPHGGTPLDNPISCRRSQHAHSVQGPGSFDLRYPISASVHDGTDNQWLFACVGPHYTVLRLAPLGALIIPLYDISQAGTVAN